MNKPREPRVPDKLKPITRETPQKWSDYYTPKLKKVKALEDLGTLSREAGTAIRDIKFFVPRELKSKVYGEYLEACDMQRANFEYEESRVKSALEQKFVLDAKLLADETNELTIKVFDEALSQVEGLGDLFTELILKQRELMQVSSRAITLKHRYPAISVGGEYKDFFAPWELFTHSGTWSEQEAREAFAQAVLTKILGG